MWNVPDIAEWCCKWVFILNIKVLVSLTFKCLCLRRWLKSEAHNTGVARPVMLRWAYAYICLGLQWRINRRCHRAVSLLLRGIDAGWLSPCNEGVTRMMAITGNTCDAAGALSWILALKCSCLCASSLFLKDFYMDTSVRVTRRAAVLAPCQKRFPCCCNGSSLNPRQLSQIRLAEQKPLICRVCSSLARGLAFPWPAGMSIADLQVVFRSDSAAAVLRRSPHVLCVASSCFNLWERFSVSWEGKRCCSRDLLNPRDAVRGTLRAGCVVRESFC